MYKNCKSMQGFKMTFLRYKRYYTFICFTVYGAIFAKNDGQLIALFKPAD